MRRQPDVKFCPVCGRRPEIPPTNEGHVWKIYCEKCHIRLTAWMVSRSSLFAEKPKTRSKR
jgi:hypothetical protein